MAARWDRLETQLNNFRYGLENPQAAYAKEYLVEDLGNALAACRTLVDSGLAYDNPPVAPRFAVAYKDLVDWFENTRVEVNKSLGSASDDQVLQRAEAIRQQGIEKLYELDTPPYGFRSSTVRRSPRSGPPPVQRRTTTRRWLASGSMSSVAARRASTRCGCSTRRTRSTPLGMARWLPTRTSPPATGPCPEVCPTVAQQLNARASDVSGAPERPQPTMSAEPRTSGSGGARNYSPGWTGPGQQSDRTR